ncbi:alpha/beta hydrolase [Methylobacterium oryzihabitans]|uniref:alpha/beta hydrolase n=1 Tax=Methylobacterium oryzihabitans TaxID=2499852 RepID=UPI001FE6C6F0|nr:alpha/beta hydrolase [Methylobacterium oryzihabitans]
MRHFPKPGRWLRRLALGAVLAALLVYATVAGVLWSVQRDLIYPGSRGLVKGSRERPAEVAEIRLGTADGETLRALWRPPAPGCGVVVSFHGNASQPERPAARFVRDPWQRHGWGLLAVAYRGYPGSTGRPSEAGLIADGLAAVAEVERRVPGAPVLLHGHSLGTAVAVAVAAERPHLGLYLEAPFASMTAMARLRFPAIPAFLLRDPWRSDLRIAGVAGPIVIVHGGADPVVPLSQGERLARAAPNGTRFIVVEGDHVSLLGREDGPAEALFRAAMPPGCKAG